MVTRYIIEIFINNVVILNYKMFKNKDSEGNKH